MDNKQILSEIVVQILGFLLIFWILRKLAWTKLLGAIDQRRKTIEDTFSDLDQKKKDLENLEKDYRRRLEHIEDEARVKIQEAASLGTTLARDIQERARLDAQKLVDRAKSEIDHDIAQAKISMRNEIIELSSIMTEKIIKEKLDQKEHQKLVDKFIKELEKV